MCACLLCTPGTPGSITGIHKRKEIPLFASWDSHHVVMMPRPCTGPRSCGHFRGMGDSCSGCTVLAGHLFAIDVNLFACLWSYSITPFRFCSAGYRRWHRDHPTCGLCCCAYRPSTRRSLQYWSMPSSPVVLKHGCVEEHFGTRQNDGDPMPE